jgi:fibronectin-binding autotransporter adhesin
LTTYVVGGVNTNSVFNGLIYDGGAAATALVFTGPGTLTLAGNNTYSGGTTVNAGTLYVNNPAGNGAGSGVVTINRGATLGGTGIIGGIVSVAAGGTLAPGDGSPGLLTITNDLSLNNGCTLQFELGAVSDQVDVSGDLTLGGTLNLTAAAGFGPGTYTLFNYGGTLGLGTLTLGAAPAGYNYTIDTTLSGQVNVTVSLPAFGSVRTVGNSLVFNGSGGASNTTYYLLTSTNLLQPLSNWTRLLTNQFDANGNFNVTNPVNPQSPQSFFLLELP